MWAGGRARGKVMRDRDSRPCAGTAKTKRPARSMSEFSILARQKDATVDACSWRVPGLSSLNSNTDEQIVDLRSFETPEVDE